MGGMVGITNRKNRNRERGWREFKKEVKRDRERERARDRYIDM